MIIKLSKKYILIEDKKGRSKSFYLKNPYQKIDKKIIEFLKKYSSKNKNCDVRVCFHENNNSLHHDMLVLQNKKNFYKPHMHSKCGDTIMCLYGKMGCFTFNKSGKITSNSLIKNGEFFKVKKKIYHVFIPVSSITIFFETRSGPFNPKDKQLIPTWSPKNERNQRKFKKKLYSALNEKN